MSMPLVSIGVPVYNGDDLLAAAMDSLLGQSLGDFELIVSDNASSDGTETTCRDYARRDARVRYVRQPRNLGAPANWNAVARLARGRYFKWAAASDLCHRDMLARCVAELERNASAVLCYARTQFIDGAGVHVGGPAGDFAVVEASPSQRFARVCQHLQLNNAQNGVIRREALMRTQLDRLYPHGDRVLMAELALQGTFVLLDDVLLYRRADAQHFSGRRNATALNRMFRPGRSDPFIAPNARRHFDFIFSALRAPVGVGERLRAAGAAVKGLYWDRRGLLEDIRALASNPSRSEDA